MTHIRPLIVSSVVGLDVLAAVAFSVDQNLATVVGVLVATVLVVVAVITWIDKRIEHKLRNHEAIEGIRHAAVVERIDTLQEIIVNNINSTSEHHKKRGA
jgi:ABC-type multidrug transport system fused ATPase/permease subunit